jgi:hypothetical protein
MSFADGWAALNLEMPPRIPRVEFDAERHWPLVGAVTGLEVDVDSAACIKQEASRAFMRAWSYDLRLTPLIGHEELDAKRTLMGHGRYAAGGLDFDDRVHCPFTDPQEAYAFDPWETYGSKDREELTRRFDEHYRSQCELYPELVNTTGTYVTLFSGLIAILGWDMLLWAGGVDAVRLGQLANRYASWMQQYYDALAESEAPVIYSHDDIVWASGAVFSPHWYREYIFANYSRLYAPLLDSGKKVIFVSDGNYTQFVDDVAAAGASGFFFEPLTDLQYIVEHYGQTHVIVGNADTRVLLMGSKADIRREVERCMVLGKECPGYFMSVTNMIPHNTPVENALYYDQVYRELCWR